MCKRPSIGPKRGIGSRRNHSVHRVDQRQPSNPSVPLRQAKSRVFAGSLGTLSGSNSILTTKCGNKNGSLQARYTIGRGVFGIGFEAESGRRPRLTAKPDRGGVQPSSLAAIFAPQMSCICSLGALRPAAPVPSSRREGCLRFLADNRENKRTGTGPHRFRKGQSGNPAGRPKGGKNRKTLLAELLLASGGSLVLDSFPDLIRGSRGNDGST